MFLLLNVCRSKCGGLLSKFPTIEKLALEDNWPPLFFRSKASSFVDFCFGKEGFPDTQTRCLIIS